MVIKVTVFVKFQMIPGFKIPKFQIPKDLSKVECDSKILLYERIFS